MLPSDSEDAELTGTEDCESMATRSVASETEDSADDYSESESEADWLPNVPAATEKTPKGKAPARRSFVNPPTNRTPGPSSRPSTLNKLGRDLSNLSLDGGVGDDSVIIKPARKSRVSQDSNKDDPSIHGAIKKKKRSVLYDLWTTQILISCSYHRLLTKKPVVTEDQIERMAMAMEKRAEHSGNVRRLVSRS